MEYQDMKIQEVKYWKKIALNRDEWEQARDHHELSSH
jgi:hypothetical protein